MSKVSEAWGGTRIGGDHVVISGSQEIISNGIEEKVLITRRPILR